MNHTLFINRLASCMEPLGYEKRLSVALGCLDAFVGANFAGVFEQKTFPELDGMGSVGEIRQFAYKSLSLNCNAPFSGVRILEYLYLAKEVLADTFLPDNLDKYKLFEWLLWRFRCYRIWSIILMERTVELKAELYGLLERLDAILEADDDRIAWTTRFQYELEKSAVQSEYFEHAEAKKALDAAAHLAGLRIELSGALGRRTRFQKHSLAQLVVSINSGKTDDSVAEKENIDVNLPTDCHNDDDTLLQRVQLDNDGDSCQHDMTEWEVLYLLQCGLEKCHASTNLDVETSLAFIEQAIACRRNWAIQTRALVERSMLERKNKRRVERACSQMELICRLLDADVSQGAVEGHHRLRLIHATSPVPFWRAQCIHADILSSLGCVAEALSVYERLKMWDELVACYKRLGQLEKAENVVRDLLAQSPDNPIYHCILGDMTNRHEHYLQAIKISNNKCARAHTSLGMLYLSRRVYKEAFEHFQSSVEIQPYQVGVWYNLGCCAMQLQRYQEAAKAYHRCVMFEPEHFEAWNNLAVCYVHLGQKERAQKVVQESIKLKHDSVKVWENLVIMSVSIDDLHTALLAVKNVMDMDAKRKLDDLPLEMIAGKILTMDPEEASIFREQLLETLARLMTRQSLSAELLRAYAELKRPRADVNDLSAWLKHVQLLEKALQKENTDNAEKTEESFAKQLEHVMDLLDAMKNIWRINAIEETQRKTQMKLRLRPLLSAVKKLAGERCENSQNERLKTAYEKASALLSRTSGESDRCLNCC